VDPNRTAVEIGPDEQLERTARHEAGHICVGLALGHTVNGGTVRPGTEAWGCTLIRSPSVDWRTLEASRPFAMWAPGAQRFVTNRVIMTMAGETAELVLLPRAGRYHPPMRERALQITAEMPAVTAPEIAAVLEEQTNAPGVESDAAHVASLAWAGFGSDWASAGAFLQFCEAQTRAMVAYEAGRIERLASVLESDGTVDGDQIAALLG
jgi:hypothetical protein